MLEPKGDEPFYSASPEIADVVTFTIGGTVVSFAAAIVQNEQIGVSEGVPGQRFLLDRRPVVPGRQPRVLEVSTTGPPMGGVGRGDELRQFGPPASRHFMLDQVAG